MISWILIVLGLWVMQTMLPTSFRYVLAPAADRNVSDALLARDAPPPMPTLGLRAERARANLQEALPVFLAVALLIQTRGEPSAMAVSGAMVFTAARVVYVPVYLSAKVPGLRSTVWLGSWVGLGMMLVALLG